VDGDQNQRHKKLPEDRQGTEFLANERTFLAWIRTSISIVSLGFVIAKFRVWMQEMGNIHAGAQEPDHGDSWVIGIAMMVLGASLAILAAWRYHVVNLQIERGKVSADRALIILVTILVVLFAGAMIGTMLVTMKN
jgi:putative membrane protein